MYSTLTGWLVPEKITWPKITKKSEYFNLIVDSLRMKFTWYGHSCFAVETQGKHLLFDPFITPNPLADHIDVTSIPADFILQSHGHSDHITDCISIAQRTGAKVICSWEIHEWLNKKGLENTHPMNTGGKWDFDALMVKCVEESAIADFKRAGKTLLLLKIGETVEV